MTKSKSVSSTTPSTTDVPAHTLSDLASALGNASFDEVLAYVDGHDKSSLIDEGARVSTPRISKDAARMYGDAYDFLSHATPEQLDHVPAVSLDWLRIVVWAAQEGDRRYAELEGHGSSEGAKQEVAAADVEQQRPKVEARREQLHAALVSFAGGDKARLAEVAAAYGSASDLSASIVAQAKLVRAWRKSSNTGVKTRTNASRLDDAWLDAATKLATDYAAALKTSTATRSKGALSQANVDHLDGINLRLLRSAAEQFEAGHAADPGIPRLQFISLRNHVHRSHHGPQENNPSPEGA